MEIKTKRKRTSKKMKRYVGKENIKEHVAKEVRRISKKKKQRGNKQKLRLHKPENL